MFPTIAEYNRVIKEGPEAGFRTLSELIFVPSRTTPVKIFSHGAGSYAVVFKAKDSANQYAIRCFISAEQENIDRYKAIGMYLRNLNASWITKVELLEQEINVSGAYYPLIKMEWVEGQLLNDYVSRVLHDNTALTELQHEIVRVSRSLEESKVGHGDIQSGNVIIKKQIDGKHIIKLIDYDGMYIPSFQNKTSLERGRTEFQHPQRSATDFDEKVDRFSFWVILCALEAIKYDKTLWNEVMQGGHNTLDNFLFQRNDFEFFDSSKLVARLYSLNAPSLSYYLNQLKKFCIDSPKNTTPLYLFGEKKIEPSAVISPTIPDDSVSETFTISSSTTQVAVFDKSLRRIGITPLILDKTQYLGKTLLITNGTESRTVQVVRNTISFNIEFPVRPKIEDHDEGEIIQPPDPPAKTPIPITITPVGKPRKLTKLQNNFILVGKIAGGIVVGGVITYRIMNSSPNPEVPPQQDTVKVTPDSSSVHNGEVGLTNEKITSKAKHPLLIKWEGWFNDPDSFNEEIDQRVTNVLPVPILNIPKNRLFIKLFMETKDPSLDNVDRINALATMDWSDSSYIDSILNSSSYKTSLINELSQ